MTRASLVLRASDEERRAVGRQLGREPRGPWGVAERCTFGEPSVIVTAPRLDDGTPFPTLWWLTCPWLVERVSQLESEGGAADWAARLASDDALAEKLIAADSRYRAARAAVGQGEDPCAEVGIGGQSDPLAPKCLHAHVAASLAGLDDPIGQHVVMECGRTCDAGRCP